MQDVSIIITCEEQETQLRSLLPQILSLEYGGEYEVIVVDKLHDKDIEEWLEDMEIQYPQLTHTFCSTTARGVDIDKLALTLGAKAANYDWLVIVPVDVKLQNEDWLRGLTSHCSNDTDLMIGIINGKRRWNWFKSYLFRRRFSLFRPTSSVILCRRNRLLQAKAVKLSKRQIVKL